MLMCRDVAPFPVFSREWSVVTPKRRLGVLCFISRCRRPGEASFPGQRRPRSRLRRAGLGCLQAARPRSGTVPAVVEPTIRTRLRPPLGVPLATVHLGRPRLGGVGTAMLHVVGAGLRPSRRPKRHGQAEDPADLVHANGSTGRPPKRTGARQSVALLRLKARSRWPKSDAKKIRCRDGAVERVGGRVAPEREHFPFPGAATVSTSPLVWRRLAEPRDALFPLVGKASNLNRYPLVVM